MSAKDKLNDICRGLHADIYHLKETLYLADFLGTEAHTLNTETFGAFFGSLQGILGRALLLHSARLFENPKKLYPLRSMPAAIALLRTEAESLAIPGRHGMVQKLVEDDVSIANIDHLGDKEFTTFVAHFFEQKMTHAHIDETLDKLKKVRDKIIAHPEAVDASLIVSPTYADLEGLVALAQHFLDVVWWGYLGISTDSDGDAPRRSTISLHRLLQRANIKTSLRPKESQSIS